MMKKGPENTVSEIVVYSNYTALRVGSRRDRPSGDPPGTLGRSVGLGLRSTSITPPARGQCNRWSAGTDVFALYDLLASGAMNT